ncbi:NHL repeat-containing protein [Leptospira perdikensis]|nr:NHL repeat-containing protein [Leptospira perdikensis]
MFRKLIPILLPVIFFFSIGCKPDGLGNHCDPKADSFLETLTFQALTTAVSYHCGYNLVNIPPFGYRHSNYRLYLNFPVSIVPRYPKNSSYSIQGILPAGLTFDTTTGEIKGTSTALTTATNLTITRNSPGFGIVTITLQVVDTSPTMVYGQYGFYTCANTYNNGSCAPGTPTNQNLSFPFGVVTDNSGGVYISGVNRIQYHPPNSTVSSRVYGQFGNFTCDIANMISAGSCSNYINPSENTLNSVREIALDSQDGLYAVDMANHRVLYYTKNTIIPSVVYGQPGFTTGTAGSTSAISLNTPQSVVAAPDGGVYISESATHRVLYFPPGSTTATRVYGQTNFSSIVTNTTNVNLSGPFGITLDSEGGLYVVDTNNNRVLYFPAGSTIASRVYGQPNFITGTSGAVGPTTLSTPTKVALDQSENLYVSDTGNNRVVVYPKTTQTAGITAVAVFGQFNNLSCGVANNNGSCGGPAVGQNTLSTPTGIFFNQLGQLYVADQQNNRVLVY